MTARRLSIQDIPWMRDAEQNHKSNWHANSKGGEPNHYPESGESENDKGKL